MVKTECFPWDHKQGKIWTLISSMQHCTEVLAGAISKTKK